MVSAEFNSTPTECAMAHTDLMFAPYTHTPYGVGKGFYASHFDHSRVKSVCHVDQKLGACLKQLVLQCFTLCYMSFSGHSILLRALMFCFLKKFECSLYIYIVILDNLFVLSTRYGSLLKTLQHYFIFDFKSSYTSVK